MHEGCKHDKMLMIVVTPKHNFLVGIFLFILFLTFQIFPNWQELFL